MLSACNSEKSNCLYTVAKKSYAPDRSQPISSIHRESDLDRHKIEVD